MRLGRRSTWLALILVLATTGASECSVFSTAPDADLAAARSAWLRRGIDDYSITISRSCECLPGMAEPAVVVVRDGLVESRTYVRTGLPVPAEFAHGYPSVEGLFDAIEAGLEAEGAGELSVDYHPVHGYPTRYVFGDPAVDAPVTFANDLRKL